MHIESRIVVRKVVVLLAILITLSYLGVVGEGSISGAGAQLNQGEGSDEDSFGKSIVSVSAHENVTFVVSDNSVDLGNSSAVVPSDLTIDVVNGFSPVNRFNSGYTYSLYRSANSRSDSLGEMEDGLRLFFNSKDNSKAAISIYNVTFMQSVNVSQNDYVSLAISTNSSYDSSEGYVGVALLFRDQQGVRQYVVVHVSNLYLTSSYTTSQYFLGSGLGRNFPYYGFRYGASSGPWFIQLQLTKAFSTLGLSSASLDGFLIGAELFSIPLPYNTTQADIRFRYALIHPQPFSINEKIVNSTEVSFAPTRFLNISGIPSNKLNAAISGSLRPAYQKEEYQENGIVKVVEVSYSFPDPLFYNFSESSVSEVRFEGKVNVTVPSKSVRKCTITVNNQTPWDLTNDVLGRVEGGIYSFPSNTRTLGIYLILYKFNAWLFERAQSAIIHVTKSGITEEYFSPETNEVVVVVDLEQASLQEPRIAVRTAGAMSGRMMVNGVQRPLDSLLLLNNDVFLATKVMAEEDESPYTMRCSFNSDPIFYSLTTQPFGVSIDNDYFEIYTPLNCEAQIGVSVPITIRVFTFKTVILRIEYDASAFKADSDELMVNKYSSYVYFMLRPVREGSTEIKAYFINPKNQNSTLSILFSMNVKRQLLYAITPYMLLAVSVLSLVYIVVSRDQMSRVLSRFRRKKT
jgi:hypothetical protein